MARSSVPTVPGRSAAKAAPVAVAAPPTPRRYLVRCTFIGEDKKIRVEGSFRFVADAVDTAALLLKLEKAVKRLRRGGELPPRCDVYVEFILELAGLDRGVVADFERWEREPRRFQHGFITTAETCGVLDQGLPTFRFGKPAEAATPAAPPHVPAVDAKR